MPGTEYMPLGMLILFWVSMGCAALMVVFVVIGVILDIRDPQTHRCECRCR